MEKLVFGTHDLGSSTRGNRKKIELGGGGEIKVSEMRPAGRTFFAARLNVSGRMAYGPWHCQERLFQVVVRICTPQRVWRKVLLKVLARCRRKKIGFLEHLEASLEDVDAQNRQLSTRSFHMSIFSSF